MTYYSELKVIENGSPKTTTTYKTGTRKAMERQFHLFCASACAEDNTHDLDTIEWGVLETGVIERKVYQNEPTPEPEPEPESNESV